MKVSIITVVFNAQNTIADAIQSVASQSYKNIEHIVVDGASSDATVDVINTHIETISHFISEPDRGIYDAMNKGIRLATGDVIGLLNADDVFQDNTVVQQIVDAHADHELDACYADLVYVDKQDMQKVRRFWKSKAYQPGLCFQGWMPAHPTLYLKRRVYERVGLYNSELAYQSDLEFCARAFEIHKISSQYISNVWVRMRLGGVTNGSLKTMIIGNWESYKALKKIGLKMNPFTYFFVKFSHRLPQFFKRA